MKKKRLLWVDEIKGFAALCVVLGHVALGYMETDIFAAQGPFINRLHHAVYAFHMPLFFLISGLLFRKAYMAEEETGKYRIKRKKLRTQLLNILILYIVYSEILGVLKIVFSDAVNNAVTFSDLFMIWAKPIQLYWYLYVLMFFYIVFAIMVEKQIPCLVLLLVTGVLSLCSGCFPSVKWFEISRILFNGFFFCLGIYLERLKTNRYSNNAKWLMILVAVALYSWYLFKAVNPNSVPALNTVVAFGLVMLLIEIFMLKTRKQVVFFQIVGKYSLEIYILHTYIATALRTILPRIGISDCFLSILISFLLSSLIPLLIGVIAKKVKVSNLLFRPAYLFAQRSSGNPEEE